MGSAKGSAFWVLYIWASGYKHVKRISFSLINSCKKAIVSCDTLVEVAIEQILSHRIKKYQWVSPSGTLSPMINGNSWHNDVICDADWRTFLSVSRIIAEVLESFHEKYT